MKKNLFFLAILVFAATASNATNVSGGIYANTTWTLANSPYIVTDTLVVFPGVTLTIEPGVVVKFDTNVYMEIRQATLIAQGTAADSITFTANTISPTMGYWDCIYLNHCPDTNKFNYCNIRYGFSGIYSYMSNPFTIRNSSFDNNNVGVNGNAYSKLFFDSCNFTNNSDGFVAYDECIYLNYCNFYYNQTGVYIEAADSSFFNNCNFIDNNKGIYTSNNTYSNYYIFNSNFKYNLIGFYSQDNSQVLNINNCNIKNNHVGLDCPCQRIKNSIIDSNITCGINSWGDSILNCEIKYNGIGIYGGLGAIGNVIEENIIENNNIGIKCYFSGGNIYCNKICNNTSYNIYDSIAGGNNISIPHNYWCTTDSATIRSTIYDGYDNINLGLVHFMPLDTSNCYLNGCVLAVTATVTNATCNTCHNGSATAQVANGFPPYTYTWYSSPIQTTPTATGLAPGIYHLCVTDSHGCTACNNSIFIDSTNCAGYSISTAAINATCITCTDGKAWVNVTGGTPPYSYTWYTIPMQATDTAFALMHGSYQVCVTDLYGCTVCDSVTVSTGSCSAYFYLYADTSIQHHYFAVNMASGVAPISYDWDWGDGTTHSYTAYPSHTYAAAGTYTICLTITDNVGCVDSHCVTFYLQKNSNTTVSITVVPGVVTNINENSIENIFVMYPNPATDNLTIECWQRSIIEISNIEGQLIKTLTASGTKTNINVSALPCGVYVVQVKTAKGVAVKKFIKE